MKFILEGKLKICTKDKLKIVGIIIIGLCLIIGLFCIKYKTVYAVTLGNEKVGYIENKEEFEKEIEEKVKNYSAKNVASVEVKEMPTYELKFVDKDETTNEQDIIIAMQKDMSITYKYYEISLKDELIESVDKLEDAQSIVDELKKDNQDLEVTITEKTTLNAEEINTDTVEIAKSKLINKVEEDKNVIANVEGIKIATLPVTGTISSRYGVSSRIRSSTHTGLDIAATNGTPIKVVSDGTVVTAQYTGAYGNLVKVDHGNGVETWYAHTSKMYVTPGQTVKAGDVIAAVGSTGNSTGAHLHFEIRINGSHVNPQLYMYK